MTQTLIKCGSVLCGILFLATGTVSAQDIIVLNNKTADEIEAKVVEVSSNEVKYKKWNYQDGPTFSVSTDEIFVIKYRNGEKQTFFEQKEKRRGDFEPHLECGIYLGYALGIGDFATENAIECVGVRVGYRLNPYFSLGGSVSNLMFYAENMSGLVPILMDVRGGYLPLGKKTSLFADFGLGVNIGYGGYDTDFTFQVGPGIEIGKFSISAIYRDYGEGAGAVSFKVGYHF